MEALYVASGVPFEERIALAREFFKKAKAGMLPIVDKHLLHADGARREAEERAKKVPGAAEAFQKMYESRKHALNEHTEKLCSIVWEFSVETARDLFGSDAVEEALKDSQEKSKSN